MLQTYHEQICQRALENTFTPEALQIINRANRAQDHLRNQFGHPEFHFDDNAFEAGNDYIDAQRRIVLDTLRSNQDPTLAWQAFGRLIHTAQDFYAHSNYIRLWVAAQPETALPNPTEVDALNSKILNHPNLQSGKIYLWDWLAFIPGLHGLAYHLLPQNSHTHMNLDSPKQGSLFPYAFEAAVKRTVHEYAQLANQLDHAALARFQGH